MKRLKTEAQAIFDKTVTTWIRDQAESYVKMFPEDNIEEQIKETTEWLPYSFHDNKTVAVDATLYDILSYGHADYGFGKSLYKILHENLKKAGYYIENEGAGVWNFVKD